MKFVRTFFFRYLLQGGYPGIALNVFYVDVIGKVMSLWQHRKSKAKRFNI